MIGASKIVPKVWGHEEWIVNNDLYCGKRLVLRNGWQCSMHRHLVKDETFYVAEGVVLLEVGNLFDISHTLFPGDSYRITPGTWHRFSAPAGSAVIYEFSTRHDDADVERREESGPIP